jgi:O-antigen/teichoic acid export membrane protein
MTDDEVGEPTRRVARGGIAAFIIYVAGAGVTYLSQLVLARAIGPTEFGFYTYVFSWLVVLAYSSSLGFDIALLRFASAYRAEKAWPLLKGVIRYAETRVVTVGVCIMALGFLVVAFSASGMSPELKRAFMIGFPLVPIWALLWIRSAAVRSFGGVTYALLPDRVIRDGLLALMVLVVSWGIGWNVNAFGAMMATLVSSVVGLGVSSWALYRLRPPEISDISAEYASATWRKLAMPLLTVVAAEAFLNRTGVLALGWAGHTTEAGIYSLSYNIAFFAVLPRTAVNTLFAPTISAIHVRGETAKLRSLVAASALYSLGGGLSIAIVLGILAEPILGLFGHGYEAGVPVLRLLLLAQVIGASGGSQLHVMTMTGHERGAAWLLVSCSVLNGLLSLLLVDMFGIMGAAVGTALALIAWNAGMAWFIWTQMDMRPGVLGLSSSVISTGWKAAFSHRR